MNQEEEVKRLWRLCFDDEEAYIDYYFSRFYRNEVNLSMRCGGELIAALQMLPYPMTLCGKEVQTAYISGVCTHPAYRNRGIMRRLLEKAFQKMWLRGVAFATLIPAAPWLSDYYARSGFVPVSPASCPLSFASCPVSPSPFAAYFRRIISDMQLDGESLPAPMLRIIRADAMKSLV